MQTRCLAVFPVMGLPKLLLSPKRIRICLPKNDQIWPKIGIFGHLGPGLAGSFSALLVAVARGLYLTRHLFTLFNLLFVHRLELLCLWSARDRWMLSWDGLCKMERRQPRVKRRNPWSLADFVSFSYICHLKLPFSFLFLLSIVWGWTLK